MSDVLAIAPAPRFFAVTAFQPPAGARDRDARWSGLMAAAQAGDSRAYDKLLRECVPLLRAICRARLREPADVEDAVQDALLTVHRVRHTYDPARPFRPWLSSIAERRALDRGRTRGRAAGREADIALAGDIAAPGRDAEAELAARGEAAALRQAVSELPASQRTALELTKIGDLSLAEAGQRSGMSVGSLKIATHRAMRSLRRRFGVED